MDPPLSSQFSQSNLLQIFRHEDASSMRIFTEAGGIHGRPLLMRKLRGHGATICTDPKSADIILVNPHTSQGRHFIRDWGNDESKVVLEYTWANKSIQAGKALLEDDDFGDCIAHDDGGPIGDEDEEDESTSKSPLPTPRITPTDHKKFTPKAPEPSQQSFAPPPHRQMMSPPAPSTSTATSSSNADMTPFMPTMSQSMPSFNPMMTMPQAQFPVQMAAAAMMNPMLMQQMFATMMMSQPGAQYNEEFKLALGDIMKNMPISQVQPHAYGQPQIPTPVEDQAMPFAAGSAKLSHNSRRSVSELSDSPPPRVTDKKGKHRATSPPTKRRRISSPSRAETSQAKSAPLSSTGDRSQNIFVKYKRPLSFFIQIDLHNRANLVSSIKKYGGIIEKDMSLADYVVLYQVHNKPPKTFSELLQTAQRLKKIAVPSKYIYDCVEQGELLPTLDYEFVAVVPGKRKRQVSAAVDSDSEHEAMEKERKRLERNERQNERRKELRLEKAEEAANARRSLSQATLKKRVKETSSPAAPQKKVTGQNGSTASAAVPPTTGRRTPPVPAEHTRQPHGPGFKFSAIENEFAINYAQILVERDHTISGNALAGEVYKKLPHHTLRSWRTQLSRLIQNDLDLWRKRASIAYRKAQRQSQAGPSAASPPPAPEGPIDIQFSSSPTPNEVSQATDSNVTHDPMFPRDLSPEEIKLLVENDLNVISTFFASTDDTEDEEQVWARLAATHECFSEPTWQKFYEKHFDEVQVRHAEISEKGT